MQQNKVKMAGERAKCAIPLAKLRDIMKLTITDVGDGWMHGDTLYLLQKHKPFFAMVAIESTRLNAAAVSKCLKDLYKLSPEHSDLCGVAMSKAFAHCKRAGDKSTTGEKIPEEVMEIYCLMKGLAPVKAEKVKKEMKSEFSSPPRTQMKSEPSRVLAISLSSPSQILELYKGPVVKAEPVPWPVIKHCGDGGGSSCRGGSQYIHNNLKVDLGGLGPSFGGGPTVKEPSASITLYMYIYV